MKNFKRKESLKETGITLLALVVTIKLNCSFFAMEQMRENVELTII